MGAIARVLALKRNTIFCLHSVVPDDAPAHEVGSLAVRASFIARTVRHLRARGIDIVPLAELLRRVETRATGACVALTFDDGYRDNHETLFPLVRELELPVTVFVATGLVDRIAPMWWNALEKAISRAERFVCADGEVDVSDPAVAWRLYLRLDRQFRRLDLDGRIHLAAEVAARNPAFRLADAYDAALDWPMIREMTASGLFEFGCHSIDHPLFSNLEAGEVERQVVGSRDRLFAETGQLPQFFAYPFGRDDEVGPLAPRVVARAGFEAGFTTEASPVGRGHLAVRARIPRVMLSSKAQHPFVVQAYMSGVPSALRRIGGRTARRAAGWS